MKTIEVTRDQIQPTAKKLAAEMDGKMYALKGAVPGVGTTRGIAILPKHLRGEQGNVPQALVIVTEKY